MQVLIAEDDVDAVELYRVALEARGHVVTITLDGRECVDAYTKSMQRLEQTIDPQASLTTLLSSITKCPLLTA